MLFEIHRHVRTAQLLGQPAARPVPAGVVPTASVLILLALTLACLAPLGVQAQTATSTAPTPSASAPAVPLAMAPPSPGASAAAPATGMVPEASTAADSNDPVTRFLAEKGLLPSTRPVVELAQQVRDKATDMASELVVSAMNFLGVPYRRGGTSEETGFDCSGFTRHVFERSVGLILPRRASEQANSAALIPVTKADLKPGDLVFFNTLRHTFSHVGIYIGDDKFIHSPRAGGKVRVEDMRQAYWQQRFDGARRAPTIAVRQAAATPGN